MIKVTPWPLKPREIETVSILQESGWSPGPVWTCPGNLAPLPTGIRYPDRPARSPKPEASRYTGYAILAARAKGLPEACEPVYRTVLVKFLGH